MRTIDLPSPETRRSAAPPARPRPAAKALFVLAGICLLTLLVLWALKTFIGDSTGFIQTSSTVIAGAAALFIVVATALTDLWRRIVDALSKGLTRLLSWCR